MGIGYVLIDGAADRNDSRLNHTTPLHSAITPNLDRIMVHSSIGSIYSVGEGIAPESDVAVLSMLGYKFENSYPGRGVIEAIGAGINFEDGMLALRANFATAKNGFIVDRRAGRDITKEELSLLEKEISSIKLEVAEIKFKGTIGHRGVLVIKTDVPLSSEITNTDPAYKRVRGFGVAAKTSKKMRIEKSTPLSKEKGALIASKLVNEFTEKALKKLGESEVNQRREKEGKLPANCILLRDAGSKIPSVEPFQKKYGLNGVAIVDMPVELGIAKILGMRTIDCSNMSLDKRAEVFVSMLNSNSIVYLHIKGPDEYGHDGDIIGKKKSIEKIDLDFFSHVRMEQNSRIAISCDHATPCKMMMHSPDPVPLAITNVEDKKRAPRFAEKYASGNLLGIKYGYQVIQKILDLEERN